MSRPPLRPATLHAVDDPDESDLDGVPRVFVHGTCGRRTHLNANTVRSYLGDPFRLTGGGGVVWCAGCQKQARAADCEWVETGQNVGEYYRLLIGEAVVESPRGWWVRFLALYSVAGLAFVAIVTLAIWQGTRDTQLAKTVAAGGCVFVAAFIAVGFAYRHFIYRRYAAEYQEGRSG